MHELPILDYFSDCFQGIKKKNHEHERSWRSLGSALTRELCTNYPPSEFKRSDQGMYRCWLFERTEYQDDSPFGISGYETLEPSIRLHIFVSCCDKSWFYISICVKTDEYDPEGFWWYPCFWGDSCKILNPWYPQVVGSGLELGCRFLFRTFCHNMTTNTRTMADDKASIEAS